MRASGTFEVADFTPVSAPSPGIETAVPVAVATMAEQYEGEAVGHSTTLFTAAADQATGTGTYVALKSFEGTLHTRSGTFNFAHSGTTVDSRKQDGYFVIVPGSGTGDLAGISGTGGIAVDDDGTHRLWFDYELGQ
ncbi:DUF3224 domain-containing protein [Streptomyces spectabilis]|uniref:DUF3224 domain-containing protein n=1 Tax=Streptomyces spectabilis TaxID=68270 RepID=A0A516R1U0_STRST|nr:DUF3224 domain-containing protein [Streptomyces spectabilis]QDQ09628.1 DUF3224 domain-containing protein [Streptomyces spectabilis]